MSGLIAKLIAEGRLDEVVRAFTEDSSRQFQIPKIKTHTTMTEADSVAEIVRRANTPEFRPNAHAEEVIVFADKTIVPLEKYADRPRRKRAKVALDDGDSFAAYVKNHRQPGTVLFGRATLTGGRFHAVLDYHESASDKKTEGALTATEAAGSTQLAQWGDHHATFTLAQTPEWQRWIKNDGQNMTQQQFAEFLEDSMADISSPPGVDLLTTATTLQMKNNVAFDSSIKLSNGQVQLKYVETIEQKAGENGLMNVPTEFVLGLQPFVGCPRYQIKARLRIKLNGRSIAFQYLLDRPHMIIEAAFKELKASIEEKAGSSVLLGSLDCIGL